MEKTMKKLFVSLAAASFIAGLTGSVIAQETTVIHRESADGEQSKTVVHKESADGEHSKTLIAREDGSRTIIKRGRHHVKKVHIEPNGDKTIVKSSSE
jgi:hypothetical protein